MWPMAVVVLDEGVENPLEVRLFQNQQAVKTF